MRLLLAAALTTTLVVGGVALLQRDGDGDANRQFCTQLESLATLDETLATLDATALAGAARDLRDLRVDAPSTLHDDLDVLVAFTDQLSAAVAASPSSEERAVTQVAETADMDAVAAAGEAVEGYARAECDVTFAALADTTAG